MKTGGERALVTGAGAGLGRAIATALATRGCAVALLDIDEAGLSATRALLPTTAPDPLLLPCDLTRDGAAEDAIATVARQWGGLDVLINNAGVGYIERFLEMKRATWAKTLALNVTALAMMTTAAGALMARQGAGRIINITSPASRMALPNYAAYAASKAAVDSITRSAAIALAPAGVVVNSVAPGMMDTDMQRSTEADLARLEGRSDVDAFLDERTRRVPLGRRAEIAEIATTILWLALDAPAYVTAERLNASGGLDRD